MAGAATGGAETFAQDMITALAEAGIEQQIVCRPHPIAVQRYAAAGVPVHPMSFSPLARYFGQSRAIRRLAETWRADLVHAWMGRAASFVPGRMPCPVIGWFGGYYALKYYRTSDVFVSVTPDIRRFLVEKGAPDRRSFVCHTFGTLPDAPPVDRAALNTPPGATVLLVLSRMHQKKGIDTAIEAMAHLPEAYLWLAGDGPELEKYQALAASRGLMDRIRFLGWRTDRKALLEAADICLLPSRYEPFGTVIAETWSMRTPLVATPADGARQFVRDGEDGMIVPFDDPASLAAAVRTIASDPALAARLIENGYRQYEQLFSRPVVVEAMQSIYRETLSLGKRTESLTPVR
jgi:glycosyltransferase involved in cell wall biosynthesis